MSGDEEAIFEFAAQDKTALRARWVVAVLEAWQRQGTRASQRKVQHFMRQFLKEPPAGEQLSLIKIIAADQEAFKDVAHLHHLMRFPLPSAAQLAAQRLGWQGPMASEVYQHYQLAVETFFKADGNGHYPWAEIFDWLQECLNNLEKL